MTTPDTPAWSPDTPHFLAYQRRRREHPELFVATSDDGLALLSDPQEIALAEGHAREKLAIKGLPPEWSNVGQVFEDE